jgi:hypothetical protein
MACFSLSMRHGCMQKWENISTISSSQKILVETFFRSSIKILIHTRVTKQSIKRRIKKCEFSIIMGRMMPTESQMAKQI